MDYAENNLYADMTKEPTMKLQRLNNPTNIVESFPLDTPKIVDGQSIVTIHITHEQLPTRGYFFEDSNGGCWVDVTPRTVRLLA